MIKRKKIYSIIVLLLVVYLLFAAWHVFKPLPQTELPLTKEVAEKIGGKILVKSFPHLFRQESNGVKLDMTVLAVDEGDVWEVMIYREPVFVETKDGKKIWPSYLSNYVVLDKATGDVVRFGFYD
ncbi:MAG: hypothetical protein IJD83_06035 [Clostridia bacterium]|nr:hypothetical protein [Clostridia bacterium]